MTDGIVNALGFGVVRVCPICDIADCAAHRPAALEPAPDLMAELVEAAKPFALHATDRAVGSSEWRDKDVVSMFVTIGQLRAIVAALAKIKEPQHG